ncbi:MAG: hypothetical protein RMK49_15320, partial [Abditibacteriales bacterium]|nr:hypothetical protein [Abditibacteriales bacterium]
RLAWERLGYAPKNLDFTLVDLSTGKRQYMRTTPGYTFRLGMGETRRRFKVVVEPRSKAPLQVRHVRAQALGDRAGWQVGFLLTRPAVTHIELLSPTGKRLAVLESGQARAAGLQSVVWNGRLQSGALLPRGPYLLRIRARDDEGREVQAVGTTLVR